jgi:signal transduction histidine kinase
VFDYLSRQLALILDRIRIYQQVMFKTTMDHAEKMQVMQSISSNIAHEMRTPLSGIRASVSGVEEYLPDLTRAYQACQKHSPEEFPPIREDHLKGLNSTLNRITLMIDQANSVIDMLLINLRETSLDENQMNVCSAAECIEQAVDRYPFKTGELEKVELDIKDDFKFLGIESLFIYVIFNLIKNSLHSIRSAQKGKIYITLETGKQIDPLSPLDQYNVIYFRDTGKGIQPEILDKIFDSFFTTKEGGTGAGLAYCKRTVLSFGGRIKCESLSGEYCEFTISLPVLKAFS